LIRSSAAFWRCPVLSENTLSWGQLEQSLSARPAQYGKAMDIQKKIAQVIQIEARAIAAGQARPARISGCGITAAIRAGKRGRTICLREQGTSGSVDSFISSHSYSGRLTDR